MATLSPNIHEMGDNGTFTWYVWSLWWLMIVEVKDISNLDEDDPHSLLFLLLLLLQLWLYLSFNLPLTSFSFSLFSIISAHFSSLTRLKHDAFPLLLGGACQLLVRGSREVGLYNPLLFMLHNYFLFKHPRCENIFQIISEGSTIGV